MIKMTPLLFSRDKNQGGGGISFVPYRKDRSLEFLGKIERGSCNSSVVQNQSGSMESNSRLGDTGMKKSRA